MKIKKYSKTNRLQKQHYATVWNNENCPMRGACLTTNVLCCAKISCEGEKYKPKFYKGICESTFKKCYVNHKKSFNAEKNNYTKLSTE